MPVISYLYFADKCVQHNSLPPNANFFQHHLYLQSRATLTPSQTLAISDLIAQCRSCWLAKFQRVNHFANLALSQFFARHDRPTYRVSAELF